jgi:hypothetical protein
MAEIIANNIDDAVEFLAREIYPYTAAIIEADRHSRPSPVGSGVLVSYQSKHYLLTAHHVTATHLEESGVQPNSPLYALFSERWEIGGVSHAIGDPFDISMTKMPVTSRKALRFPDHFAFDVTPGEACFVFGFPARSKAWNIDLRRFTLRPTPLTYLGSVYRLTFGGFSVKLSRKHVSSRGKKLPRLGKLNGISGGGAFVLRNDAPRLAGIITEYHSNTAEIVCTGSGIVAEIVRQLPA